MEFFVDKVLKLDNSIESRLLKKKLYNQYYRTRGFETTRHIRDAVARPIFKRLDDDLYVETIKKYSKKFLAYFERDIISCFERPLTLLFFNIVYFFC